MLLGSLIGNLVGIEGGPAAVIGDELRNKTTGHVKAGKVRSVVGSENQKTCLCVVLMLRGREL